MMRHLFFIVSAAVIIGMTTIVLLLPTQQTTAASLHSDAPASNLVELLFEGTELSTSDGFMWGHTDDRMANGKSVAEIAHVQEQASNGVLQVSATVNPGFAYPWAGAAIGDFAPPIQAVDLTSFTYLVFNVKGTPSTYRVMAFDTNAAGIPPSQNFNITEQWQTITIKLSEFRGFDKQAFSGFAIVAGPNLGKFDFMLDDVSLQ